MLVKSVYVLIAVLLGNTAGLTPSPGCSIKKDFHENGEIKTVKLVYEDQLLGPVDRNYIIQFLGGNFFFFLNQ